ncbi:MAG: DUF4390 domain-containing protein [Diaphorobacter sp.]|nr:MULTISPECIES: DUF4390 domain-containing protein [Diaphorobacter]MBV2218426.1 DUF4390 domain-containing protein [Diaphorobacter sp.]
MWAALVCLLALWIAAIPAAHAQQHGEIVELQLDPLPEGLYLSATLQLELPELVKDALYKGISVFFITEAEVVRQRWYWSDKVVAQASRFLRLSYQPLTRRWRVVQSSTPFAPSGLGVSLGQNFDTLQDALASMQRIARWKIADEGQVDEGVTYVMNFQFRLDTSQLPRPLQIGAVGRSGWNMVLARSVPLSVVEAAR